MKQDNIREMKMIQICSNEELLSLVHKEKNIYIYGAGEIAQSLLDFLPADGCYQIDSIIVTQKQNDMDIMRGIAIKEVSEATLNKHQLVLIGTGKKWQEEIYQELRNAGFLNVAKISREYETFLNEKRNSFVNQNKIQEMVQMCIKRITPRTRLKSLVVNICNHCNLNCRGCDHFSPIADKILVDKKQIEKDLSQLQKIIGDAIDVIAVMGGEPLLHPDLIEILNFTRKIFPKNKIWLGTNGILLLKQQKDFWECCKNNDIVLAVTKYPIAFSYDEAEKISNFYGVEYFYYDGGKEEKTLGHYPLDIEGNQDALDSFINCFHANNECNTLSNGKLYTCTVAPNMPIFCEKFNISIPLTEEDGIDIYSVHSKKELFELLSRPMPVCRFCDVHRRTFGHEWGRSKACIEEWT